jgi:hypothetical protein
MLDKLPSFWWSMKKAVAVIVGSGRPNFSLLDVYKTSETRLQRFGPLEN